MNNVTAGAPAGASSSRALSSWALDGILLSAPCSMAITSLVFTRGAQAHGLLLSALRAPTKLASVFCLLSAAFWLASLAATFALRWPEDHRSSSSLRFLDREAAGSAAAASAVVSLLFALEAAFLWESPRRRRLRRALAKSFAVLESSSSMRRRRRKWSSSKGGISGSSNGRIAAGKEEEEGSSSGRDGGGSGNNSEQKQPLPPAPPRPPHLRGGPLVAASVAALGSAWGFAAAAFLIFAAASPSRFPGGEDEEEAGGSSSNSSSLLLSALPLLPRGLPARGISLLAAAGCFAAAVTTTHGVGGRATAGAAAAAAAAPASPSPPLLLRRSRFRFWQPFRGGGAFIATQAVGWSLTGLGTLGFLKVSAAVLSSAARTSASAAAAVALAASSSPSSSSPSSPSLLFDVLLTAALMPVAQAVLALSISLWDASSSSASQEKAPRLGMRGRGTRGKGSVVDGSSSSSSSSSSPTTKQQQRQQLLLEQAAARSRSHPNSLPPLSTWAIIALIYAPAHLTISAIVAVLALSPLFGGLLLTAVLAFYYAVTERGDPATTGRRRWPAVADALARAAEPALAAWHGGLEVVHDDLEGDAEWEALCSRAEEDVGVLMMRRDPAAASSSRSPSSARRLVRAPLSAAEPAILGVAPHGLFPASLLYLGRLRAFARGGRCWPRGRPPPTPAVASAVMRVPVLRDLASFMGARAVTRAAIADALSGGSVVAATEEGAGKTSSASASAPSVALVPGGQSELIHAWRLHDPSRRELVLVRRHAGFVRVALRHGAALVPVLALGEAASLADAISLPGLKARSIKALGFPVPFLVSGRFFPGSPLPRGGTPLRFVVGPAIRVAKVVVKSASLTESGGGGGRSKEEETEDEKQDPFDAEEEAVAEAHERYFKAVERLFARHRAAAGHGDVRLVWADEGPERKMVRRGGSGENEEEVGFAVADASVTVSVSVAPSATAGKAKRE